MVLGPTGAKATQVEGINTLSLTGRGRVSTPCHVLKILSAYLDWSAEDGRHALCEFECDENQ